MPQESNDLLHQEVRKLRLKCKQLTDALKSNENIRDTETKKFEAKMDELTHHYESEKYEMCTKYEAMKLDLECIFNSNIERQLKLTRQREYDIMNLEHQLSERNDEIVNLKEIVSNYEYHFQKLDEKNKIMSNTESTIHQSGEKYGIHLTAPVPDRTDSASSDNFDYQRGYECDGSDISVHLYIVKLRNYILILESQRSDLLAQIDSLTSCRQEVIKYAQDVMAENHELKQTMSESCSSHTSNSGRFSCRETRECVRECGRACHSPRITSPLTNSSSSCSNSITSSSSGAHAHCTAPVLHVMPKTKSSFSSNVASPQLPMLNRTATVLA